MIKKKIKKGSKRARSNTATRYGIRRYAANLEPDLFEELSDAHSIVEILQPGVCNTVPATFVYLLGRELPRFRGRQLQSLKAMLKDGQLAGAQFSSVLQNMLPEQKHSAFEASAARTKERKKIQPRTGERVVMYYQLNEMTERAIDIAAEVVSHVRGKTPARGSLAIEIVEEGVARFFSDAQAILRRQLASGALRSQDLNDVAAKLLDESPDFAAEPQDLEPLRISVTLAPSVQRRVEEVLEMKALLGRNVSRIPAVLEALMVGLEVLEASTLKELVDDIDSGAVSSALVEMLGTNVVQKVEDARNQVPVFLPVDTDPIASV